jgi:hypothetical protein
MSAIPLLLVVCASQPGCDSESHCPTLKCVGALQLEFAVEGGGSLREFDGTVWLDGVAFEVRCPSTDDWNDVSCANGGVVLSPIGGDGAARVEWEITASGTDGTGSEARWAGAGAASPDWDVILGGPDCIPACSSAEIEVVLASESKAGG